MNKESLVGTLVNATAHATDVYFGLYKDYFENGDEPEEALRIILEYPAKIGDTGDSNPQNITLQEENRITCNLEYIVGGTANRIANMNLARKDFYKKLYVALFNSDNDFFPQSREEKVITLKILAERVLAVPYYQIIETEKISREEFEEGVSRLQTSFQEAYYMLNRQFPTTPEQAAQIVRIADNIPDKRQQIIFWTIIINNLRSDSEKDPD